MISIFCRNKSRGTTNGNAEAGGGGGTGSGGGAATSVTLTGDVTGSGAGQIETSIAPGAVKMATLAEDVYRGLVKYYDDGAWTELTYQEVADWYAQGIQIVLYDGYRLLMSVGYNENAQGHLFASPVIEGKVYYASIEDTDRWTTWNVTVGGGGGQVYTAGKNIRIVGDTISTTDTIQTALVECEDEPLQLNVFGECYDHSLILQDDGDGGVSLQLDGEELATKTDVDEAHDGVIAIIDERGYATQQWANERFITSLPSNMVLNDMDHAAPAGVNVLAAYNTTQNHIQACSGVGSQTQPIYIDTDGVPTACAQSEFDVTAIMNATASGTLSSMVTWTGEALMNAIAAGTAKLFRTGTITYGSTTKTLKVPVLFALRGSYGITLYYDYCPNTGSAHVRVSREIYMSGTTWRVEKVNDMTL